MAALAECKICGITKDLREMVTAPRAPGPVKATYPALRAASTRVRVAAPEIRARSSWYFSKTPRVALTVSGSSSTQPSATRAWPQSRVSATPGSLNRSLARSWWTNATICAASRAGTSGARAVRIASSRAASG